MDKSMRLTHWQRLKSVYPFIYLIGFRFNEGGWPHGVNADAHKGWFAASVISSVLLIGTSLALGDALGIDLIANEAMLLGLIVPLIAVHAYLLVGQGVGIRFEKRFDGLPRADKRWIEFYSAIFVAFAIGVAIAAGTHHRHLMGADRTVVIETNRAAPVITTAVPRRP